MACNTIILFGAGATKACGGPLTNEILPQAFELGVRPDIEREKYIDLQEKFLIENFHLPQQQADRTESDYPRPSVAAQPRGQGDRRPTRR